MPTWAFSLYFTSYFFAIHFSVLLPYPTFKDKCSNNCNGHVEREDQFENNIWIQHDLNAVFDAIEHVRVLTDKSSTCVYTAFREAFILMSLMGCLSYCLWIFLVMKREYFSSVVTNVSCPCLHDRSISRHIFVCVVHTSLALIRWYGELLIFILTWPLWTLDSLQIQWHLFWPWTCAGDLRPLSPFVALFGS